MAIPYLPDNAPFSTAQRSWLNGFFAGIFGLQGATPVNSNNAVARTGSSNGASSNGASSNGSSSHGSTAVAEPEADEEFPWHDAALPLADRMALAEGKKYPRKLMAAMAQLDCGACGYLCKTYSEAIADGTEKDLTKCAPGGKETSRKLKELVKEGPGPGAVTEVTVKGAPAKTAEKSVTPTYGRHNPFPARLLKCSPLNKPGSSKDTRYVALSLAGSGLTYKVGDALGVFPENDLDLVGWVIEALDASGAENVIDSEGHKVSFHEALVKHYSLGKPTDLMFELLINSAASPDEASALKEILSNDSLPEGDEVLDLLRRFPSARPSPEEFVTALNPLQPRLYSISSSLKAHPDEVHLTVGVVRFLNSRERQCKGVCSTFFSERLRAGQKVRVFIHASHGFTVPQSGETPMIMVGPGTGIAPFRAFLEERKATMAVGKNWLLFGDQQKSVDFLYEEELESYRSSGFLTRLDTAFSRDQKEKIYVQHRMMEHAAEIWKWLQEGAHFYVCGDAKRMATDVDNALKKIVAEQGGLSPDEAKAYVADLTKSKRYQRDVY